MMPLAHGAIGTVKKVVIIDRGGESKTLHVYDKWCSGCQMWVRIKSEQDIHAFFMNHKLHQATEAV